jgi:hypothetical protein
MPTTKLDIDNILELSCRYHAYDQLFWTFEQVSTQNPLDLVVIVKWLERHPPLVFPFLNVHPPENRQLTSDIGDASQDILRSIIKSANDLSMACLSALERISRTIFALEIKVYYELIWLATHCLRSSDVVQEVLLVMNDCRCGTFSYGSMDTEHEVVSSVFPLPWEMYALKHALGVVFDRAGEAADECPCDETGKPRKQRTPPSQTKLTIVPEKPFYVKATLRIDARTPTRLHSHVRLASASKEEGLRVSPEPPVLDGLVVQSLKGEVMLELMQPIPPELELLDWNMYDAGSTGEILPHPYSFLLIFYKPLPKR